MTTATELHKRGVVERVSLTVRAPDVHWRRLYAEQENEDDNSFKRLVDIFKNDPRSLCNADLSPKEQLNGIIRRFIIGEELIFDREYHALWPGEQAIWELKTPDLRLFGFFTDLNEFLIVGVGFKDDILEYGLVEGYREAAARFREKHSVQCLMKSGEHDVISIRS